MAAYSQGPIRWCHQQGPKGLQYLGLSKTYWQHYASTWHCINIVTFCINIFCIYLGVDNLRDTFLQSKARRRETERKENEVFSKHVFNLFIHLHSTIKTWCELLQKKWQWHTGQYSCIAHGHGPTFKNVCRNFRLIYLRPINCRAVCFSPMTYFKNGIKTNNRLTSKATFCNVCSTS